MWASSPDSTIGAASAACSLRQQRRASRPGALPSTAAACRRSGRRGAGGAPAAARCRNAARPARARTCAGPRAASAGPTAQAAGPSTRQRPSSSTSVHRLALRQLEVDPGRDARRRVPAALAVRLRVGRVRAQPGRERIVRGALLEVGRRQRVGAPHVAAARAPPRTPAAWPPAPPACGRTRARARPGPARATRRPLSLALSPLRGARVPDGALIPRSASRGGGGSASGARRGACCVHA